MPAYPMMTFYFVRHGQARAADGSYGPQTPLSTLGRTQAERVAQALAERAPPAAVYSSPFPRAVETAAPLCQRLGLEALIDPRLAEYEVGTKSLGEAQQRQDLLLWRPGHRGTREGETLKEFSLRVASACEEIAARHCGEGVAVFAHAGTIDAALRWALGIAPSRPWQHEFDLTNASVTEVAYWPRGRVRGGAPRYAFLKRIADAAHLDGLASEL